MWLVKVKGGTLVLSVSANPAAQGLVGFTPRGSAGQVISTWTRQTPPPFAMSGEMIATPVELQGAAAGMLAAAPAALQQTHVRRK
jgi:hypothetical protein